MSQRSIIIPAAIGLLGILAWVGWVGGRTVSAGSVETLAIRWMRSAAGAFRPTAAGPVQGGIGSRTVITTIAGGGIATNAPAKEAPMVDPSGAALDPQGRGFYVLDNTNGTSLLRFVNTTGNPVTLGTVTIQPNSINLIAGGGAGDSETANETDLTYVSGMAVDPSGNAVYLTTPFIGWIRAVNVGAQDFRIFNQTIQPGRIRNVYQINRPDFRAIVVNAAREFFYIGNAPNSSARVVFKLDSSANGGSGHETIHAGGGNPVNNNGDGGLATLARLISPMALAIDPQGNLVIADGGDNRNNPGSIRKVDAGGFISLFTGGLEFPTGLTITSNGMMYAALGNAQQVVRIAPSGARTVMAGSSQKVACDPNTTPTCGDGGPATSAYLNMPGSTQLRTLIFAVDANGIILPELAYRRVRYVNLSSGAVSIAGTSIGAGQIDSIAGSGQAVPYDNVPATISELASPTGVALDANGNLFIADTGADPVSRLRFVNRGAAPVTLFATTTWAKTVQPGHIVTLNDRAGDLVNDDRISTAVFAAPQGLLAASNGVYLVDSQYGALVRPPGSLNGRRSGHVRFLNTSNSEVTIFPGGGAGTRVIVPPGQIKDIVGRNDPPPFGFIGDNGPANTAIIFPTDIAFDAQGNLLIADQGNSRIRRVNSATGIVTSVTSIQGDQTIGPLTTNGATGIALGPDGRLYIADTRADRILRQDGLNANTFTVIANNTRSIGRPRDLLVDPTGNVFVVNSNTHQILRVIAPANALGAVNVVAGTGNRGFSGDGGAGNRANLDLPTPGTTTNDLQVTANLIRLADGNVAFTDTNNGRIRLLTFLPNQNPVLSDIPGRTMDEGTTGQIDLSATDGNQDALTFSAANLPGFAALADNGNGTARLTLAPGFTDAGSYSITVSVSDGDAADTRTFTVVVRDVNRPPAVTANPIASPLEAASAAGRQVELAGSASDADGDPISYKWFDGASQIAATANAQVTLGLGAHSIFLLAADNKGGSTNTAAQNVVVQDTTPPVISDVPADITVQAVTDSGAAVNYAMPAATDLVSGGVPVVADKASGSFFEVGATTVKFTATDGRGNASMAMFKVTVTPRPTGGGGGGGTPATPSSYTISTHAGNGNYGNDGNYGPGLNATFRQINALGSSAEGVAIVDAQSRTVRRVDPLGVIRPFAGNGANGNAGDNGQAIFANFGSPGGVAFDGQGNAYVSDTTTHRVRRVAPDGRITHFAGSSNGLSGNIGDNGQAAVARLNRPLGLAVDAQGNVYIADSGNNRIRVVNAATNIITTVAGNGGAGYGGDNVLAIIASLNGPSGIAIDSQGNLFIADRKNHRVRRVEAVTGMITTIAGDGTPGYSGDGGSGSLAQLNAPADVSVDAAGNVYIADMNNHRVRRLIGAIISTIAGTGAAGFSGDGGPATAAQFSFPSCLRVDADNSVYVGELANQRVRKLAAAAGPTPTPTPVNRNPALTSTIGNQTLTRGQSLDLPLSATDADGDSVTFSLINGPAFASIVNGDPGARTAMLRLAPAQAGAFNNVQVRADDGRGGSATSAAFNITVNDPLPSGCLAAVPSDRWKGEYFNNRSLNGSPAMIRDDGPGSINFEWGFGGPSSACGLGVENFSVRWSRELQMAGGVYRFTTFSDDGIRLYIDGASVLDRWIDRGETRDDVDVTLTAGRHTIVFEYYENGGLASARLFINALNYAPVIGNIAAQAVRRGQVVDVEVAATDSENDPVALTLEGAPAFVTLVNANAAQRRATMRIAPPAGGANQSFMFNLIADDGRGNRSSSNPVKLDVTNDTTPQNRPPVAAANPLPATIAAPDSTGATIRLDGSASADPDGDALGYSWTDQGAVIASTAIADVKLPIGNHLIALTVNDGKGGVNTTVAQSVAITAPEPPSSAPVISSVSPPRGNKGTTVNIVIQGSGFAQGLVIAVNGGGITATVTALTGVQLNVKLVISGNAQTTSRSITVTNPGGASATRSNAFAVYP
ncbi:MAG: Ig-like domain-containing protein [Blastocatellia bacterium]